MESESDHEADAAASATRGTSASISAAIRRAEIALKSLKQALKEGKLDDAGSAAANAASALLREGEALLAESPRLAEAEAELRGVVRRNPLASLGVAFAAGVVVALLTRS